MTESKGKCGCGAIEYSFSGGPFGSAFCYCKSCQVRTGSDKYFGLWVKPANFKITKGTPTSFAEFGDSGKEVILHFCGVCSTNLYLDVTVGNFISVVASTLNDTEGLVPQMAIYTASAPTWALFPENVPKFDILPPAKK